MSEDYGHWKLDTGLEFKPDALGFVYIIAFNDGHFYIGIKQMLAATKKNVKLKNGNKVKRRAYKESDWKTYKSSSNIVKERISNGDIPTYTILSFKNSKSHLKYYEAKMQFENGALINPLCLNNIINLRISKLSAD